jgi:hypothetical protein
VPPPPDFAAVPDPDAALPGAFDSVKAFFLASSAAVSAFFSEDGVALGFGEDLGEGLGEALGEGFGVGLGNRFG